MSLADGLKQAFKTNAEVAEMATSVVAPPEGTISAPGLAVARDLGLSDEEASEIMDECLLAASGAPDVEAARRNVQACTIAVGQFFGIMVRLRQTGHSK